MSYGPSDSEFWRDVHEYTRSVTEKPLPIIARPTMKTAKRHGVYLEGEDLPYEARRSLEDRLERVGPWVVDYIYKTWTEYGDGSVSECWYRVRVYRPALPEQYQRWFWSHNASSPHWQIAN